MFSPPKHLKGIFMKKIFPLVFALVMGSLLLSGCNSGDPKAWLPGKWVSDWGDGYEITPTTVTYYGYGGSVDFAGTIKNQPDFEASAGIIVIEYTIPQMYYYDAEGNLLETPFKGPGDFYAIYWKELTVNTVELSNAYTKGQTGVAGAPETTTLAEALQKFTLDTAGTYAAMHGIFEKH
jgi:hypothetical protein